MATFHSVFTPDELDCLQRGLEAILERSANAETTATAERLIARIKKAQDSIVYHGAVASAF